MGRKTSEIVSGSSAKPVHLRVVQRVEEIVRASGSPKEHHLGEQLALSLCDLKMLPRHIEVLYVFPASSQSEDDQRQDAVEVLKSSLATTLCAFYPLAGRFKFAASKRSISKGMVIDCNNAGARFVYTAAEGSLCEAIPDLSNPGDFPPGLTAVPPQKNIEIDCAQPLFTVQVTEFSCGGMVLSASYHHLCCDGDSFFEFMKAWGCVARGQPFPHPCHDRSLIGFEPPKNGMQPSNGARTAPSCEAASLDKAEPLAGKSHGGNGEVKVVPTADVNLSEPLLSGSDKEVFWSEAEGTKKPHGKVTQLEVTGGVQAILVPQKVGSEPHPASAFGEKGPGRGSILSVLQASQRIFSAISSSLRVPFAALHRWSRNQYNALARAYLLITGFSLYPPTRPFIFSFSPEELKRLKAMASASESRARVEKSNWNLGWLMGGQGGDLEVREIRGLASTDTSGVSFVSTNDALTAHLWQSITRARGCASRPRAPAVFRRAVNTRKHFGLPATYFGNSIVSVPSHPIKHHFYSTAGDLLGSSVGQVARVLRLALNRVDAASCYACWSKPEGPLPSSVPPILGHTFTITSWLQFNIFEFHFGYGKPAAVWGCYGKYPGLVDGISMVQASPKGDGGVDVVMLIPEATGQKLLADPFFKP